MSRDESANNVKTTGGGGSSGSGGMRECDEFNFEARGGDLCISYTGVAEGEEYELIIQGRGCRSVFVCRVVSGRWECDKK
jgi:hypothetical protein